MLKPQSQSILGFSFCFFTARTFFAFMQDLEAARQETETQKAALAEQIVKFNKVVKTARGLKAKHEALRDEREESNRDLEEAKGWVSSTGQFEMQF